MADLTWLKNRGRNGWDDPLEVSLEQSVEARNVTLYKSGLGARRGGSIAMTESGLSLHNALIEHIPAQDLTAAELFIVDGSAPVQVLRSTTGTLNQPTLSALTLTDAVSTAAYQFSAVTLNGKLYCAYDSPVNRLHVFDPLTSTTTLRRAGMGTTAAPTATNTGSGSYAATIRYYAVRFAEIRSGVTIREGEASPILTFTPSGSGTAARVTKPASLSENETHWILEASADGVTFYDLATTVVGTTTYDDSGTVSAYANGTASPSAGARTPFPSVQSLATDGTRLFGLGVWESTAGDSLAPKSGRVYIGPVLDSTSTNDDERINNTTTLKGWIDLARNSGAVDRGLTPRPINGVLYAFQSVGVYGLVPTESATTPYRRVPMSSQVGAVNQASIVMAQDRAGRACAYFLDPVLGPHVVGGADGLRWCGKDVKDLWATFNPAATVPAWGIWYPDRNLVLWGIATSGSSDPNVILALDVTELAPDAHGDLRGGFTAWDGTFAAARCAVMFSSTLATTRARTRVPYVGLASGTTLLRYDETAADDNGTPFQAYVTSGSQAIAAKQITVQRAYVVASAQNGVSLRQTLIRNTGEETRTSDVLLTATGSEIDVQRKFEDASLAEAWTFQVKLGDASAQAVQWSLRQWFAQVIEGAYR